MKAVITGAGRGIGREIALILSGRGYDVVLVSRSLNELSSLSAEIKTKSYIEVADLSIPENVIGLFSRHTDAEIIVNCAGVGVFGEFDKTDLAREIRMIDLNVTALHVLTKLYYREFIKRGRGYILNVSSSAAFFVGPLYSSYYATKAYVHRLTRALSFESRKNKYGVNITLFCPGPVDTTFGKADEIKSGIGAITPRIAAKRAVDAMFKGREVAYSNFKTRLLVYSSKLIPEKILTSIVYKQQVNKQKI